MAPTYHDFDSKLLKGGICVSCKLPMGQLDSLADKGLIHWDSIGIDLTQLAKSDCLGILLTIAEQVGFNVR